MSVKLTGYVWDVCAASGMRLTSVAVMARIADFSNDDGVCWPSIETIARQLGAGVSTVRTAIAKLEADGWLSRKKRRQGNRNASNIYRLNVARLQAAAFALLSKKSDPPDSDPPDSDPPDFDPPDFDPPDSGKTDGFHPPASGGDPSVNSKHDPSFKTSRRKNKFDPAQVELPGWLSPDLWREWAEFRRTLQKPIKTPQGAAGAIRQLAEFREQGISPERVIRHSIANEYQGLYPPKDSVRGRGDVRDINVISRPQRTIPPGFRG